MSPHSLSGTLPNLEFSLLELPDRLLDKGVALTGEATISVAGVDLVYLGLNATLAGVETILRHGGNPRGSGAGERPSQMPCSPAPLRPVESSTIPGFGIPAGTRTTQRSQDAGSLHEQASPGRASGIAGAPGSVVDHRGEGTVEVVPPGGGLEELRQEIERLRAILPERETPARDVPESPVTRLPAPVSGEPGILPARVEVDPEGVGQGLAKLVLSLVEFLRQVLERQAVRRLEGGTLTDEEAERVGLALMRLQERLHELAAHFGLRPDDLNINFGLLGNLL